MLKCTYSVLYKLNTQISQKGTNSVLKNNDLVLEVEKMLNNLHTQVQRKPLKGRSDTNMVSLASLNTFPDVFYTKGSAKVVVVNEHVTPAKEMSEKGIRIKDRRIVDKGIKKKYRNR